MTEARHEDKSDSDGYEVGYEHSKTKDVSGSGAGKHDDDDRGGE